MPISFPNFTLHLGDSMEIIASLPDNSFQTIFADPPYFLSNGGISVQSGKQVCVDKGDWDKGGTPEYIHEFNMKWLSLCRSKLKENGTIWISGTYHNIFAVANCLTELGYKILNVITWQKSDPPPNLSCKYFNFSTEFIIWARKSEKKTHKFNYETMRFLNGDKQMTDVWKLPAVGQWEKTCGKHPTQKPLRLLYRIILASTDAGDLILDPFAGSSTTGIAANLLGRNFVGIEREQEFYDLSIRRREDIEDETRKTEMLRRIKDNNTESTVMVNYARPETMKLMIEKGICYLRAGDSQGSLLVKPGFDRLKYVLLHNSNECHLYKLTKTTFQIWTADELNSKGFDAQHAPYYAVLNFDNSKEFSIDNKEHLNQGKNTFTAKIMNIGEFVNYIGL